MNIEQGDIFDIGQTVNGISKFVYLNDTWYYFEKQLFKPYEYDQDEITNTVLNLSGLDDITYLGNVYQLVDNVKEN